jgi:hypothetical protein
MCSSGGSSGRGSLLLVVRLFLNVILREVLPFVILRGQQFCNSATRGIYLHCRRRNLTNQFRPNSLLLREPRGLSPRYMAFQFNEAPPRHSRAVPAVTKVGRESSLYRAAVTALSRGSGHASITSLAATPGQEEKKHAAEQLASYTQPTRPRSQ